MNNVQNAILESFQNRRLRPFAWEDRSRTLVQIPNNGSIPFGDINNGWDQRFILPDSHLQLLVEQDLGDWFLTSTYLFPARSTEPIPYTVDEHPRNECLLVSFASIEDAFVFAIGGDRAHCLPREWWREFEEAEYRQHPEFLSVETSKLGLIRIYGVQQNVGLDVKLTLVSQAFTKVGNEPQSISMTVQQLVDETWGEETDHDRI